MALRLTIDGEDLDRLPWEMMRDQFRDAWLANLSSCPLARNVVRRRPLIHVPPSREAGSPLKVLIVSASPADLSRQPVDIVLQGLERHLADLQREGKIVTKSLEEATLDAITRANEEYFDIFLFVGHGQAGNGREPAGIFLHDERNLQEKHKVSAEKLSQRINDKLPRMVFLASCQTSTNTPDGGTGFARTLLTASDIPAVVAMQTFVGGGSARDLTGWFLRNAAKGAPVDVALATARETLIRGNTPPGPDVFCGVMYLQSNSGDLFELNRDGNEHPIQFQDLKSETRGETYVEGTYNIRKEGTKFRVSWQFSVSKNGRSGTGKGSMSLKLLGANSTTIYEATRTLTVGANPLYPSSRKEASDVSLIDPEPVNILFDVNADSDTSGIL